MSKTALVPPSKRQEKVSWWIMDIQFTNDNSRSIIFSPCRIPDVEPPTPDPRSKYWWKRFTSGNVRVMAICPVNPKWTDETFIDILRGWKAGRSWRTVDMRRKEDRS